jgi:chaperonin GroES
MRSDYMKLRPLDDRLVVKPIEREDVTNSGIVLPDTAKEKPQEGLVEAAGTGRLLDNGARLPMEVKVGDRVLYARYAGNEFKLEDIEYLVLSEKDVLAVISGKGARANKTKK